MAPTSEGVWGMGTRSGPCSGLGTFERPDCIVDLTATVLIFGLGLCLVSDMQRMVGGLGWLAHFHFNTYETVRLVFSSHRDHAQWCWAQARALVGAT